MKKVKRFLPWLFVVAVALLVFAAAPDVSNFNPNQFGTDGQNIWILNGVQLTNAVFTPPIGGGGTNSGPIALSISGTNVAVNPITPLGCSTNAPLPYRLTLTTNVLVQNPSPTALDGQTIIVEFLQDATGSRLVFFDTQYAFGTDISGITLTTTANKRDFATFKFNGVSSKWYCVGYVRGY